MTKNPAEEEDKQRRLEEVIRLRRAGVHFADIGARFGVTKQRAYQLYKEGLAQIPFPEVVEYRNEQLERLDALLVAANKVLAREHYAVSNGKVVYHNNNPVRDDGPVLAAIAAVVRIEERRAKLLGLDMPARTHVTVEDATYRVLGVGDADLGEPAAG